MVRRGVNLHKTKILRDDSLEFTVESGQQFLWSAFVGISLGLFAIVIIIGSIRQYLDQGINNRNLSGVLFSVLFSLFFVLPLSLLHIIPSYKKSVTFQKQSRKILVNKHKLIKLELPFKITINNIESKTILLSRIENIKLIIGNYSKYVNHHLSFFCDESTFGTCIACDDLSLICEITDKVYENIGLPITIIDKSENQGSSLKFVLSKLNRFKVPYYLESTRNKLH